MRILHVLGKLDRGGVETWLVQALRAVDRRRYQMDFVVHTSEPGAYDNEVRSLGARILPCLGWSNPVHYARNFRRVLRESGPYDVVHSHVHHYSGFVLLLAATEGVPVRVAHAHNDTRPVDRRAGLARKTYFHAMKALLPTAGSGGFAASAEAGDSLFPRCWRASSRWPLLHYGIDLSRFQGRIDHSALRRSLGIPDRALVVGHVGRFDRQKNHGFLVEIAREFLDIAPHAVFLLVGDGGLRREIEEAVRRVGVAKSFIFTGVRPDVADLLRGAMDVLLFPSLFEGLPVTVLEAQAAGLPCLISDVITREADVIPGLVVRQSLARPAPDWAQALRRTACLLRVPPESACSLMQGRSINRSTEELVLAYEKFASLRARCRRGLAPTGVRRQNL